MGWQDDPLANATAMPKWQADPVASPAQVSSTPPAGAQPGSREYADWAAQQARAGNALPQVSEHQTTQSSVLDPFVQGVTFGWGDEMRGAVQGGLAAAQGGDFGSTYAQVVDESRNALERERQVNPVGSFAAEFAGAIPTGIALGGPAVAQGATLGARALAGAGVGAAQGAAYGAGSASDDQRLEGATTGAVAGGALGAAAPYAGNALAQTIRRGQQGAILDAAAKNAPSASELKTVASDLFEQATGGQPIGITDNTFFRFLGSVKQVADKMRINPDNDQASVGLLGTLMRIADDTNAGVMVDLKDLHLVRQLAQDVAQGKAGRDKAFGSMVIRQLDDFVQKLTPGDVAGGADPSGAVRNLMLGMRTWAQANKVSMVEEAIRVGSAAASGPQKGIANALRAIYRDPAKWNRFSSAEQQAMKDVINGTAGSNVMKMLGTFGFGTNTATNGVGGAAGMALGQLAGGPLGMIAGAAVGSASRRASEAMTERLANRALGAVATDGLQSLPQVSQTVPTGGENILRSIGAAVAGQMPDPQPGPLRIVVNGAGSYR